MHWTVCRKYILSYATFENSWTSFTMHSVPIPNFSRRTIGGPDLGTSLTHIFLTKILRVSATASRTASPIPPYWIETTNLKSYLKTTYTRKTHSKVISLHSALTYLRIMVFNYDNLSITLRSIFQDSLLVNWFDGKWVHYSNLKTQCFKLWICLQSLV